MKTAHPVLKKVLDAAGEKLLQQPRGPRQLIGCLPEGHCIWLGTHDLYSDARRSAGGVHRETGSGLLKVSERKEAMQMLLEGYQGM